MSISLEAASTQENRPFKGEPSSGLDQHSKLHSSSCIPIYDFSMSQISYQMCPACIGWIVAIRDMIINPLNLRDDASDDDHDCDHDRYRIIKMGRIDLNEFGTRLFRWSQLDICDDFMHQEYYEDLCYDTRCL